jgi:beta-lactam-binding protein with PASTA domain
VKAPNLVSKTLDEAKSMLSSLRLNAIVFYHETKQFKSGTVLSQDPIEGEEMKAGGAIKIFISITPTGESKGTQKSKENE